MTTEEQFDMSSMAEAAAATTDEVQKALVKKFEKELKEGIDFPKRDQLPDVLAFASGRIVNDGGRLSGAICQGTLAALAAAMNREVKFLDSTGTPQDGTFISLVAGNPACGKSFSQSVVEGIIAPIKELTEKEEAKKSAWKVKRDAASTKKEKAPKRGKYDTRYIPQNTTGAAFAEIAQDLADCHSVGYLYATEFDVLANLSDGDYASMLQLIFDGGELRKARFSTSGASCAAKLSMSVNITSTPSQIRRWLPANKIQGGLSSRLMPLLIPEGATLDSPKLLSFDEDFRKKADGWLKILADEPAAVHEAKDLQRFITRERQMLQGYVLECGDKVLWRTSIRVLLSVQKMGFTLWLLDGKKLTRKAMNYLHWVFVNALRTHLILFGETLEKMAEENETIINGPVRLRKRASLIEKLPVGEFSLDDLVALRAANGFDNSRVNASLQCQNWLRAKLIERVSRGKFRKL